MAREIRVDIWCDVHLSEDEHVEGAELPPLSLDPRTKPKVLALCDVHRKELYDPLVEALAELGQVVDGAAPTSKAARTKPVRPTRWKGGELKCPAVGCDYAGPSRDTLSKHVRKHHDTTLREIEAAQSAGASLAAAIGEPEPISGVLTCPECGKKLMSAKGLGAHRQKSHGVAGTSKASRDRRRAKAGDA